MNKSRKRIKFSGFPQEGVSFLRDLRHHNNRVWFEANKTVYREAVEQPAKAFLGEMCTKLELILNCPVDGKIFRIYRDLRFSEDKTPYNTHMRMGFSACGADTKDCAVGSPKFYFSLEPDSINLGCGILEFTKDTLTLYRDAVIDEKKGPLLVQIVKQFELKDLRLGDAKYKRVPYGYDKNSSPVGLAKKQRVCGLG